MRFVMLEICLPISSLHKSFYDKKFTIAFTLAYKKFKKRVRKFRPVFRPYLPHLQRQTAFKTVGDWISSFEKAHLEASGSFYSHRPQKVMIFEMIRSGMLWKARGGHKFLVSIKWYSKELMLRVIEAQKFRSVRNFWSQADLKNYGHC